MARSIDSSSSIYGTIENGARECIRQDMRLIANRISSTCETVTSNSNYKKVIKNSKFDANTHIHIVWAQYLSAEYYLGECFPIILSQNGIKVNLIGLHHFYLHMQCIPFSLWLRSHYRRTYCIVSLHFI